MLRVKEGRWVLKRDWIIQGGQEPKELCPRHLKVIYREDIEYVHTKWSICDPQWAQLMIRFEQASFS